jgi:hypothetical protein
MPYLGEIDAKSVHVEPVEKAGERLAKPGQTLVHKLEVHHIRLEVGHGVRELRKCRFEGVEGKRTLAIASAPSRIAKGGS